MSDCTSSFLNVACSVTGKRWLSRSPDDRAGWALAQGFGLPEIVGRVLAARGVTTEACERFLSPTVKSSLPDPSRLRDMDKAADRIATAVMAGEPIAVFGDYDVDGATSAALWRRFFRAVGREVVVYVPDRVAEGYGPNAPALRRLAHDGIRLVVTVDCGTTAFAPLEAAAEAGLDVVVLDHHVAEPRLPPAVAVVNPNRIDEEDEGLRGLCAAGVCFLAIVAVNRALRCRGWYADRPEPDLIDWLDLVALGTVCDVVPLVGLNRAFVAQGLKVMAKRGNPGIAALADIAGLKERPDAYHAGFVLGPRVNAGGRVGGSDLGARLLATDDPVEAADLARRLDLHNAERREMEQRVVEEAITAVEAKGALADLVFCVGEDWHPGVVGIVASRLKERYGRPACVVAIERGENGVIVGKGSGRSVRGVDLGAAVIAARQAGLLIAGGGHKMAAGFTVAIDRMDALQAFLAARIASEAEGAALDPTLDFDGALSVTAANVALVDMLERIAPFGTGNPEPRFAIAEARVIRADVVGANHVRCILAGADGGRLKAIAFRSLDSDLGRALLGAGAAPLHLAGTLRADHWNGTRSIQLFIEDAAHPAG